MALGALTAIAARIERALAALLDWGARSARNRSALIAVVALAMLAPGTAGLPVTDRDEARFAQATKQMLETGDLVDIRFQDKPRWKKPAGIYWLQAAGVAAAGGPGTGIWAYRLPSLAGAVLAAVLLGWAAHPLVGARGAVLAGLMLPACLIVAAEANIAKTDAALMATGVAVIGALARVLPGGTAPGWPVWLGIWGAVAAAILIKGPIVPAIAGLALVWLWVARRRVPPLARLRPLAGLGLAAALAAPWFVAIAVVSDGAFFAESVGKDLMGKVAEGQEMHWGPPGLYLALLWLTLWPWAGLLVPAAPWLWRRRRADWLILLAGWVIPFWVILEAVPTKLPHYVLPLYPALVIALAGWAVAPARPAPSRRLARIDAGLLLVPGGALALAMVALPLALEGALPPGALVGAVAGAGLLLLAARAALAGRILARIGASLGAALALYTGVLSSALPALETVFPSPRIAAAAAPWRACAGGSLVSAGYREPSLVFLAGTRTRMPGPGEAARILAREPGALVLVEDRWLETHLRPAWGGDPPDLVARAELSYFNYNRGSFETARLWTREDPRWAPCAAALGRDAARP